MPGYSHIRLLTFDEVELPLPMSVQVTRRCEPAGAGGDTDAFATSVQTSAVFTSAEVRLRGIAAAEALSLGQAGLLSFETDATADDQEGRTVQLAGAVLVAVETTYTQNALAAAVLHFVAEASDGQTDPFSAEASS